MMGVYHLMGLGRSPGTVIGPISYLAHRYQRWNANDQNFFARSGEVRQRETGEKVGDIQALVLFTTPEILNGEVLAYEYVDNQPGQITKGLQKPTQPMKDILYSLLRREWPQISGGRTSGTIYWCTIYRRDIRTTYERMAQIIAALAGVGGQGKEIWANLTGGNNVMNTALQLAAMLSGDVARLYYVQAENRDAEKCVCFTAEDGYWVELPVMPLALSRLSKTIIKLLEEKDSLDLKNLYSILRNEYWDLSRGLESLDVLRDEYLTPMWKQGLIAEKSSGSYVVGPQWELIRPYQESLEQARKTNVTIEMLAGKETWITQEELPFT